MSDSYYLVIRGKKYDRRMVELADGLTRGRGDGRISVNDAKNLLRVVKDANNYSDTEKATMEYIRRKYKFTKEGDAFFRTEIRKWAGKRGAKGTAKPAKKSAGSATKAAATTAASGVTAEPSARPAAPQTESAPAGGAWKEILFALFLLIGIAALFYFIVYKSGWVKPAAVNPPAEATKTPEAVKPAAQNEPVKPVTAEPAQPAAAMKPVAAPADIAALVEKTQVRFIAEKTELTPAGAKALDELAQKIKTEKIRIQITGHTCSLGPKSLNQEISVKRAKVVKEALVARGVEAGRLEVRGLADGAPVGDNKTVAGRVANRRVDFKVIK